MCDRAQQFIKRQILTRKTLVDAQINEREIAEWLCSTRTLIRAAIRPPRREGTVEVALQPDIHPRGTAAIDWRSKGHGSGSEGRRLRRLGQNHSKRWIRATDELLAAVTRYGLKSL